MATHVPRGRGCLARTPDGFDSRRLRWLRRGLWSNGTTPAWRAGNAGSTPAGSTVRSGPNRRRDSWLSSGSWCSTSWDELRVRFPVGPLTNGLKCGGRAHDFAKVGGEVRLLVGTFDAGARRPGTRLQP